MAGASKAIFTEDAYHQIYLSSAGVPRRINNICDLALLVGYSNSLGAIDRKAVLDVSEDLDIPKASDSTDGAQAPKEVHAGLLQKNVGGLAGRLT